MVYSLARWQSWTSRDVLGFPREGVGPNRNRGTNGA
jgi:hypothetical protein